ncbi:UDP-3-O-(3-hydroxymyristoyl)glucosamine N-acyltransferase [Coprobacter tertius]|uniref:UDP-3-O-acylglucosamine N-acyltransferase n=1 Tax=Coprobacter tertius TaxID=2944915 RepID=A0ABT1MJI7_9BACT|nr:UDP-3-O-(3-hydroxymyristoyl)glucosamine N-acyltransferase [Coprobacter tertius]MCP9612041.1 UDP-3-O-(3-hydroxymyristoyl)glucosamine N-acyltransferase [Coprobacter tertius]
MEFTAQQIADFLQGEVIGDGQIKVNNLSKIDDGQPETLTFLANPKYNHYLYTTRASVVLVNRDFIPEEKVSVTLIKVDDAYSCIAQLLNMVNQARPEKKGIDSTAVIAANTSVPQSIYIGAFTFIGENVKLGENIKIYPQVYIGDNVTIGDNTTLYPGVKIYHDCVIGKDCMIHAGTVIGADGFGFAPNNGSYQKIAQIGNVIIEDHVEIGANTTIDRATMGSTIVHEGAKLDNLIQVAHNVEVGSNTVIAAQTGIAGSTKIGNNCMIGGQVGFAGHITIGDRVNIGAQSGIPNHVKSDVTLLGYPAVPAREFARSVVMIKKLPELNKTIRELQEEIENLKKKIDK